MSSFILVLLLVALVSPAGGSITIAVNNVHEIKRALRTSNLALGVYSRTASLNAIGKSLQGEDNWRVKEKLDQVMTVLFALDVLGGGIAPVVEHLLDVILHSRELQNTRNLWASFSNHMKGTWQGAIAGSMTPEEFASEAYIKKQEIFNQFEADIRNLPANSRDMKYINRARKWFRLKTAAKVIGPLFDVISIGVNSWNLHTALRDCSDTPHLCNHGAIASAGLGIAAGTVGLVTFFLVVGGASAAFGPAGMVISAILTITATLIELFYTPSDAWVKDYNSQVSMMKSLAKYSRLQLYVGHMFMARHSIYNSEMADLYVVNQGHLPKWNLVHTMDHVSFGQIASNNPRQNRFLPGLCDRPIHDPESERPSHGTDPTAAKFCTYVTDGNHVVSSVNDEELGYGFYGLTRNATSTNQNTAFPAASDYGGSIVLITTDKVQKSVLEEDDIDANLRGITVDTQAKANGQGPFNDVVFIGNMENLDDDEQIVVTTGGGSDALVIEGKIGGFSNNPTAGRLNAQLGTVGHNVLNLHEVNDSSITGVVYDPQNGALRFRHGTNQAEHLVGTVTNVEVLGASALQDHIKLYASKRGFYDDFTVFKYAGIATYELNIQSIEGLTFAPRFKIVDSTTNEEGNCAGHYPLLKITNFRTNAVINDILYNGTTVKIYGTKPATGTTSAGTGSSYKNYVFGKKNKGKHNKQWDHGPIKKKQHGVKSVSKRYGGPGGRNERNERTVCTTAQEDNTSQGGTGKQLLATVAFYTKCLAKVEAKKVNDACMMVPRELGKLDLVFRAGQRITSDFTETVTGSVCTLLCPPEIIYQKVAIDLRSATTGYLIINEDLFLEPCSIGSLINLTLSLHGDDVWLINFRSRSLEAKFQSLAVQQEVYGVDKIIDEFGNEIFDMTELSTMVVDLCSAGTCGVEFDLYRAFAERKAESIARYAGVNQSSEIMRNMLQCIDSTQGNYDSNICEPVSETVQPIIPENASGDASGDNQGDTSGDTPGESSMT